VRRHRQQRRLRAQVAHGLQVLRVAQLCVRVCACVFVCVCCVRGWGFEAPAPRSR
jgi:hypothetical protein